MLDTVTAAGLTTCRAGRKDPKTRRCPQRCLKLLMVQCTEAEQRDARVAQLWIESLPASIVPRVRPAIARLTARYGLIFQPRMLVCPRCVGGTGKNGGVRYGNHPETVRQNWRRRRARQRAARLGAIRRLQQPAADPA